MFIRKFDDKIYFKSPGGQFYFQQVLTTHKVPRAYVWAELYKNGMLKWHEKLYLRFRRLSYNEVIEIFGVTEREFFNEILRLKRQLNENVTMRELRNDRGKLRNEVVKLLEEKFNIRFDKRDKADITALTFLRTRYHRDLLVEVALDKGVDYILNKD